MGQSTTHLFRHYGARGGVFDLFDAAAVALTEFLHFLEVLIAQIVLGLRIDIQVGQCV